MINYSNYVTAKICSSPYYFLPSKLNKHYFSKNNKLNIPCELSALFMYLHFTTLELVQFLAYSSLIT